MTRSRLRLTSDGTNLTAAMSGDGQTFTPVGRAAALAGITDPKVGLFALQGGGTAPVIDAAFDWFQISPDEPAGPVDPSDEFTGDHIGQVPVERDRAGGPDEVPGRQRRAADRRAERRHLTPNNTGPTNFILQTAPTGDWTVETKVDGSAFNEQYQQGGLLVYVDDDNYLKLDYIADNAAGQPVTRRIEYRSEIGAAVQNPQPQVTNLTRRCGTCGWSRRATPTPPSYSADGTTWTAFEPLTNAAVGATPKVGLFSLGAAQTASKPASFDYFRLSTGVGRHRGAGDHGRGRRAPVNGWYTGPATVTLAATDNGGAGWPAPSTRSTPPPRGPPTPSRSRSPATAPTRCGSGRSTRRATSRRRSRSAVKIDATAPVTTATFAPPNDDGWHNGTVPVTLTSTDAGSGVGELEYSLDGGAWTPYTAPVDVTGDGEHDLRYRATDAAGNVETIKSAVITIDATKPTLLVGGLADGQLYGDSQDVRVTFQAVDPTSGIRSVVGTLDGRAYQTTRCRPCTS